MHYVFLDTGDETFFSKIASAFCSNVVQSILELHEHNVFNQMDNSPMLDYDNMEGFFTRKDGQPLRFLNCHLFPSVISICINDGCKEDRVIVLTNEQVVSISQLIIGNLKAHLRARDYAQKSGRERSNAQAILQNYTAKIISKVEVIQLGNKSVRKNYSDYLDAYIRKTNTLSKNHANGFTYIRSAGKKSDFNYFINNTTLQNVMPCDYYQHLK